jgi:hypothetical protein
MPKFYFDIIQIDGKVTKDTVGTELPDVEAAKEEAKRCLADMSPEAIQEDLSEVRILVRDAQGTKVTLRIAHFAEE